MTTLVIGPGGIGDFSFQTSFKNKIINGNFDIWQRSTSSTSPGYSAADRWKIERNTSTGSYDQGNFAIGQTAVPNNPRYFYSAGITSGNTAGSYTYVTQRIENLIQLSGKNLGLSFWAKVGLGTASMSIEFVQNFGTGGSPSAEVNSISVKKISLTSTWQKFRITAVIPSLSSKTLGTNEDYYLGVNFWMDAGSDFNSRTNTLGNQSITFNIAQVQLEENGSFSNFEVRPPFVEMVLCQRYYQKTRYVNSGNGVSTFLTISSTATKCVPMRVTPSESLSEPSPTNCTSSIASINKGSTTINTVATTTGFFSTSVEVLSEAEL